MSRHNIVVAPETVIYDVQEQPIKTNGTEVISNERLREQAEAARARLVEVDYYEVPGTCGDERPRVGLYSGEGRVEPRPSVFGGPNIYALGVAELSGYFDAEDHSSGEERLTSVTERLEDAHLKSGGHGHCAANAGFVTWMRIVTEKPEYIKTYARKERGKAYNEDAMNEVVSYARAVVESGRYADWSEGVLTNVLGEEKSGEAMEKLADVPHEGETIIRNRIANTTVDQTDLYDRSVVGKGSFEHDDGYADVIEHAIASGADATHMKLVAEHAREAIIAAVAAAVPNEELYQINFTLAA